MPKFDWLPQVIQRIKYRGAVAMLMVVVIGVAVVFGIVGIRATTPAVQITIIVAALLALFGFFSMVIWLIRRLGVFALLETNQMVSLWKDQGAKGMPSPPMVPPIPDPHHVRHELPASESEE